MKRSKLLYLFLMVLVLFLGFKMRLKQLDFPSIGYHNMKENEYISIARNMEKSGDFVRRDVDFYHSFDKDFKGETFDIYPQIPLVSYQIIVGDRLFGRNLWFPRLFNVILFMSAVILAYFLTKKITNSRLYGLAAAALLSFFPLGVFFSRNLQPEPWAFFIMMLTTWFFLKFIENFKPKYILAVGIGITLVVACKMSFLFGLLPLLAIFPYKEYFKLKKPGYVLFDSAALLIPLAALAVFWTVVGQINIKQSIEGRTDLSAVFTSGYWAKYGSILWHYTTRENYTLILFWLSVAGASIVWVRFKNDKTLLARYLRGGSLALFLYFIVFNDYLRQHSYYQFPFLFFLSLAIVYFWSYTSRKLFANQSGKAQGAIFTFFFSLSLILAYSPAVQSIDAAFGTIFFGSDAAGEYIKAHTQTNEKFAAIVFCQGYGTCVYSERKCGFENDLKKFKEIENREHIKYIAIFPFNYERFIPPELLNYIYSSYSIDYIGFILVKDNLMPQVMILKKGGRFNLEDFLKSNGKPEEAKIYFTDKGPVKFFKLEKQDGSAEK